MKGVSLKPHQKRTLYEMVLREQSEYRLLNKGNEKESRPRFLNTGNEKELRFLNKGNETELEMI